MSNPIRRWLVPVLAALACLASSAPAALASTSPTLTLDQSAGTTAGATANLGLDLKFNSNPNTDSPRDLTINLPPGLLANAAIDGGACLRSRNVSGTACEVGTGTVTAAPVLLGILNLGLAVPVSVNFYLVPPPAPGDLAGLAVMGLGEQLGTTGDVRIRPSGDPAGVGVTIGLVLPNQLTLAGLPPLTPISVQEINSTFDGLRYPASCPQTLANLDVAVDSYADPATTHSVAAPLSVTGCGSLPYAPAFTTTAVRDTGDRQVQLTTVVTQAADEAPSRAITLAFPTATLAPNIASIQALCLNPASGTCQAIGTVEATSPLYPTPLSGKAYLTGSSSGLSLTLQFPAPFPLTLTGSVNLLTDSATFTGLPDIPLTNLTVSLLGGADGLFLATCQTPTGTATATLTNQNGDRTLVDPSTFTVAGCPGTVPGAGIGGAPLTGAGGTGAGPGSVAITGTTPSQSGPTGQNKRHGKSKHKPQHKPKRKTKSKHHRRSSGHR